MRIGILGLGTIATALVKGIADDDHILTVSRRNAENAADLCGTFANVSVADNQEVVDNSDALFIGLTDNVYRDALSALRFRADQMVISLMAGPEMAELVAPATLSARMIPLPRHNTQSASGHKANLRQHSLPPTRHVKVFVYAPSPSCSYPQVVWRIDSPTRLGLAR